MSKSYTQEQVFKMLNVLALLLMRKFTGRGYCPAFAPEQHAMSFPTEDKDSLFSKLLGVALTKADETLQDKVQRDAAKSSLRFTMASHLEDVLIYIDEMLKATEENCQNIGYGELQGELKELIHG